MASEAYVLPFDHLRMQDVGRVGGKNASLGEMITQLNHLGVRVPGGFATTAGAYREFLNAGGVAERIDKLVTSVDVDNVKALYSAQYPELTTAVVNGPEAVGDKLRYTFDRAIGSKG